MTRKRDPTPLLDEIVDEVVRGERMIIFAPGIIAFVSTTMGLLFGSVLFCAIVLPSMGGPLALGWAPLAGIGAALITLCVSTFFVAQGYSSGYVIFQSVTGAWLALAALSLAATIAKVILLAPIVAAIPSLLLAGTFVGSKSSAYLTFVRYKQRLRERRRDLSIDGP